VPTKPTASNSAAPFRASVDRNSAICVFEIDQHLRPAAESTASVELSLWTTGCFDNLRRESAMHATRNTVKNRMLAAQI